MQEQLNSVFQLTCCFLYLRKCYILYKKKRQRENKKWNQLQTEARK